jgi:hypothetical protein
MDNGWDGEYNSTSLTDAQRLEVQMSEWALRSLGYRQRLAARYGSVTIPSIDTPTVRMNFLHYVDHEVNVTNLGSYTVNRVLWFCHNCGAHGFKQGDIRELFKCYCCRSRNVTICRSGDISMAIRSNSAIGINMQDVYRGRQERQRTARRVRRETRERAQIEGN